MNSSKTFVGILVVIVLVGVGYYALQNRSSISKDAMVEETSMVKETEEAMEKPDSAMMKQETRYVPFTPEVLASTASTRRVLFFYANWCPTCKPADKDFSDNVAKIPSDVTVIRVNYNDTETDRAEEDLADKYGITYQHTYVQIDADGEVISKWNGGAVSELLANIK